MDGWSRAFRNSISYFLEFHLLGRPSGSCFYQLEVFYPFHSSTLDYFCASLAHLSLSSGSRCPIESKLHPIQSTSHVQRHTACILALHADRISTPRLEALQVRVCSRELQHFTVWCLGVGCRVGLYCLSCSTLFVVFLFL